MKIRDIYSKYNVTPNLAEHMLLVTSVALFIYDHWIGEGLDRETLKRAGLVHDIGNIVKFDFEKHPEFLGKEKANLDKWREIQKDMVLRYGPDDHVATRLILKELGFDTNSMESISSKSFGSALETLNSDNWNIKVLLYSDLRVMPFGVNTLDNRLKDIRERLPKYSTRLDFENLCDACRQIESEIQTHVDISLSSIDPNTINVEGSNLLDEEI